MDDRLHEILELRPIEDRAGPVNEDALTLLIATGTFSGVDLIDYDNELNAMVVAASVSWDESDLECLGRSYNALINSTFPSDTHPLDSNTLINLTFPSDKYDSSSWGYDCPPALIAVSPGPEEAEEAEDEATVSPPPKLNRCVTPPVVVSKTRSSSSLKTKSSPPDQGIVTPPRGKMKRKKAPKIRAPRKKEPNTQHCVLKTDSDVLFGRGTCSNRHVGNAVYRAKILELQPVYAGMSTPQKTQCSQGVVDWVRERGGKFLDRDDKTSPWYIATDQMARRKVSQALREDHSPDGKEAKRARLAQAAMARNGLDQMD